MSKVSEALELFRTCQTDDKSLEIMIDAIPEMAALLSRCKPVLESALSLYRFKAAWSEDEETCDLYTKKKVELESILAEMSGEEKKDEAYSLQT